MAHYFPYADPALIHIPGAFPVLFVAPHATTPVEAAAPFVESSKDVLSAHIGGWHDTGSGEALDVAVRALRAPGFKPALPRGLLDLNRGWKSRDEGKETLFGKGALDAWAKAHVREGATDALEKWYRGALSELRAGSTACRGFVEIHSYGDLGSTHDQQAGGRPVRRSEAAVVAATPWATAFPVGLARLIPGDLRGCPWDLQRRVGDALVDAGLHIGPNPYPAQGPWALSMRFLAARWFAWLGQSGQLPAETAARLVDLTWTDEQHPIIDAIATGQAEEGADWRGIADLAAEMGAWSHAPGAAGDRFLAETGTFTLVAELRNDKIDRAEAFGECLARAVGGFCAPG